MSVNAVRLPQRWARSIYFDVEAKRHPTGTARFFLRWLAAMYVFRSPAVTETLLLQQDRACALRDEDGTLTAILIDEDGRVRSVGDVSYVSGRRADRVVFTMTRPTNEMRATLRLAAGRFVEAQLSMRSCRCGLRERLQW